MKKYIDVKPDGTDIQVGKLIDELSDYPLNARIAIEVVGQTGTYTISYLEMNKEHNQVKIHGTV